MNEQTLTIHPIPRFNFALTAENQPYFRREEDSDAGQYQRLLDLGEKLALATVDFQGSIDVPQLAVRLQGESLTAEDVAAAGSQLELLLATEQDVRPFYAFCQGDPVMAQLAEAFYGLHLARARSVFEAIAQAILGQQLAASVARVIRGLLVETYGPSQTFDGQRHYAFPRPQALAQASVEELRRLKLSQRKAEYLQGVARAELETPGGLDSVLSLPDEEAVRQVTALRGVGHWTAQWVLSRAMGRPDAFPSGDLALKRIVSHLYFGGETLTPQQLEDYSWRWSPYRSFATAYLFAALRTGWG